MCAVRIRRGSIVSCECINLRIPNKHTRTHDTQDTFDNVHDCTGTCLWVGRDIVHCSRQSVHPRTVCQLLCRLLIWKRLDACMRCVELWEFSQTRFKWCWRWASNTAERSMDRRLVFENIAHCVWESKSVSAQSNIRYGRCRKCRMQVQLCDAVAP